MRTVLVPLDGSLCAEHILPSARALATLLPAHLHLLSVVGPPVGAPRSGQSPANADLHNALFEYAEMYLDTQAKALRESGFSVTVEARFGEPAETILAAVGHVQADLIAMSTHGYSGLRRWALGSVTDKVMQLTSVPLLVARGTSDAHSLPATFTRILVPLDGSALARQALAHAVELATRTQAELVLLRVVGFPLSEIQGAGWSIEQELNVDQHLRQEVGPFAETLQERGVRVRPLVQQGTAAEVIIDTAAHLQADLIVMATHGYGGIRRWALGSVADKVLHAVATPLLLVRAKSAL